MMTLKLIPDSDPILHRPAEPVNEENPDRVGTAELISQMFEVMKANNGIGLAAPQVGVPIRLFVMQTRNKRLVCINSELLNESADENVMYEGCLSYPNVEIPVKRSIRIKVRYLDENFNRKSHYLNDLDARVWLHEHQHTQGITMIDVSALLEVSDS